MKIKILGISGSPRHGNSEFLLNQAIDEIKKLKTIETETEIYSFVGKSFSPCRHCLACVKTGECIIEDDMQELKKKWLEADAIIYSVPVYHMSMPSQLKAFIDRLGNSIFAPAGDKPPKFMKVIGIIAQGIHIFSGQEHTLTDLINHTLVMGCIPIAGDPWESYIGVGAWTRTDSSPNALEMLLKHEDFDTKISVKAVRILGKRAVYLASILKAGVMTQKDVLNEDLAYSWILSKFEKKGSDEKNIVD